MKPNPNLDELLSSFMDGELSPRQRTEVQRLAAHDPRVARRLRQLENSRSLLCSLPAAKAPADLLDQIKIALERQSLLQEPPLSRRRWAGVWSLAFRRCVSAAAVIALMGVLGVVIYQIVAPIPTGGVGSRVAENGPVVGGSASEQTPHGAGANAPMAVADTGFTGRLELRTARLLQAEIFLARTIEDCGLAGQAEPDLAASRRVYRIAGTREGVNRLVASLSGVWQNYFDSAALEVDRPGNSGASVVVEAITPEQAVGIVAQNSSEASVEAAQAYAVMNRLAKNAPGSEIRPLLEYRPGSLLAALSIPKPRETGPDAATPAPPAAPAGKAQVSLTIVLESTI
jgi:hypothetical protein